MFDRIYNKVIQELEQEAPEWMAYHNAEHTRYVVQQAERISQHENVQGRNLLLVKLAALYHDIGFLIQSENHEVLGCRRASEDLEKEDLTPAEVSQICNMIKATRIPQTPSNILEQIVADADLEYLGTDNFAAYSNNLYEELLHSNSDLTPKKWDEIQIDFLTKHSFHTDYCKKHRAPGKKKNLEMIKDRLPAYGR